MGGWLGMSPYREKSDRIGITWEEYIMYYKDNGNGD